MKIYFHELAAEDIAFDTDGSFKVNNRYFWNYLEYGTNPGGLEEVAIVDGCGRYIPVSLEGVPGLITALQRAQEIREQITQGAASQELAESDSDELPITLDW